MAILSKDYQLSSGLVSDQAYIKATMISGNKHNMSATIEVYISKEASDSGLSTIDEFTVVFTPDVIAGSANYHTQTYIYLKSLPQFENAIDVLED